MSYHHWINSQEGQDYLTALYQAHGAQNPQPHFRLLVVAQAEPPKTDQHRLVQVLQAALEVPTTLHPRLWLTTGQAIAEHEVDADPLGQALWIKASHSHAWIDEYHRLSQRHKKSSPRRRRLRQRQFLTAQLPTMPRYRLFPET